MAEPGSPIHAHPPLARPSPWIERFAPLVAPGSCVLDVACGQGRHARLFARLGHRVVAVDRDAAALAAIAGEANVQTRELDLEAGHPVFAGERFDAIVVANYLHRPLLAELIAALAADGVLLYETFARGNEAFGRPRHPEFLLAEDELLERVSPALTVVAFEQGLVGAPGSAAVVQRLAAVGRGRPWPPELPDCNGAARR
jgi:SAM-dependent methyltransferase